MAVVFLVVLFLLKTPTSRDATDPESTNQGLSYSGNAAIGDLIAKDTDLDGVLDWEESLWGTDPTKKDTNDDGTADSVEIEKLKAAEGKNEQASLQGDEKLTKTDEFSQELFATIVTLNQNGTIDKSTIDKLSTSLVDRIQNSPPEKIYTLSDIKIANEDSVRAVTNYNNAMGLIAKGYKGIDGVIEVLREFVSGGDNPDVGVLSKLDLIIDNINKTANDMLEISVPQKLAQYHLNVINVLKRIVENLNGIKLYENDPIVSIGAVSQYINNIPLLESTILQLREATWKGLGN